MHPACPNKKPNHLQNSFLRRTQFWGRKTFSKPASLKRASLVALPAAISHKASLKPKTLRFCNLDTTNFKKSKKWDRLAVPFLGPHAPLSKKQKKSIFTVSFLGPSGGAKHIELEQRRPAHAKPDFN